MLEQLKKKKALEGLQKSIAASALEDSEVEQELKDHPEKAEEMRKLDQEFYFKASKPSSDRDMPEIEKTLINETPGMSDSEYLKRLDALEQLKKKKLLQRTNAELTI